MATVDITVNETMDAIIVDGVQYFTLRYQCTDNGIAYTYPLPDKSIFLLLINDIADATKDTFARVVEIADFDTFANTRAMALARGDSYWRSESALKYYTDFEVAVAAKQAFHDKFNLLGTDWETYKATFETVAGGDNEHYPYAVPTDSEVAALQTAYYDAFDSYTTALNDLTTGWLAKKMSYDTANQKVADYAANKARVDGYYTKLATVNGFISALKSFSNIPGQAGTLYNGLTAFRSLMNSKHDAFKLSLDIFHTSFDAITHVIAPYNAEWADADAHLTIAETYYATNIWVDPDATTTTLLYNYNLNVMALSTQYDAYILSYDANVSPAITDYTPDVRTPTTTDYNLAISARATAYSNLSAKQADLTAKRALVTGAMASVIDICPDYTAPRGYESSRLPAVPSLPVIP